MKELKGKLNYINQYNTNESKINHVLMEKENSDFFIVILCEKKLESILSKNSIMESFNKLNSTVLLMDDFIDNTPTLYLGIDGKETIIENISSLLKNMMLKTGYEKQRLIICGHGRAGAASLILGSKVDAKYLITSFPSLTFQESFEGIVNFKDDEILDYVVGNVYNESENIIDELVKRKIFTNQKLKSDIYIHGNIEDSSTKKLTDYFSNNNQHYQLNKLGEYDNNETLFLKRLLLETFEGLKSNVIIKDPLIKKIDDYNFSMNLRLDNINIETMDIAIYFYSKDKRELAINYNKDMNYKLHLQLDIIESIKIFVKVKNEVIDIKRYFIKKN